MLADNSHIESFLQYYCSRSESPEYAVLIKGNWGCGKTWFVKRHLRHMEERGAKSIYVSLNGLGSFAAIEREIFQRLHPILGSKGMALAGKVISGALKATLKIDLDGDGKEAGNLDIQLPSVSIPTYLSDTSGFVLVFDDLERCAIPVPELLGYLNHFVEHAGHKMILLANEDEIISRDRESTNGSEADRSYGRIKEKLVGKSFELVPDACSAIRDFVTSLANARARDSIAQWQPRVVQIFEASGYMNLRHVRQALLDAERLIGVLPQKLINEVGLVGELLSYLLIYSIEIKSGSMKASEIGEVARSFYGSNEKGEESLHARLSKKYSGTSFLEELLPAPTWVEIIDAGFIDEQAITLALERSKYFAESNQPAWVTLWHAYQMTDDEVGNVLPEVARNFENGYFLRQEVMLHVAGILLWLSKIDVYNSPAREIVQRACEHIDALRLAGRIAPVSEPFYETGYGGLGFHERESPSFKLILNYLKSAVERGQADNRPAEAKLILESLSKDGGLFYQLLTLSNSGNNRFYDVPILMHIDVKGFVDAFLAASPESQRKAQMAVRRRYEFDEINRRLIEELDWLSKLECELSSRAPALLGKVSGYRLQVMAEGVAAAIAALSRSTTSAK